MFGRKKKERADSAEEAAAATSRDETAPATTTGARQSREAETNRSGSATAVPGKSERANGPHDLAEVDEEILREYVDLGALKIKPIEGMGLNLEVEEDSGRVVAVAIEHEGSRVQLQAFAAPKSSGMWEGISASIDESVTSQGGRTDRREGRFGEELLARVPVSGSGANQGQGTMVARFVGVDGPRWFLRAVFAGPAAISEEGARALEDLVGELVVDRGQTPLPPTELLPLQVPEGAASLADLAEQNAAAQEQAQAAAMRGEAAGDDEAQRRDQDPRRGPEITQIG